MPKKRTATEVAERRGTLSKNKYRRDDSLAPRADGKLPDMPDYLDDFGREKWSELLVDLKQLGILSSDMRELMVAYCEAYSGWRRCLTLVRKIGPVIMEKNTKGEPTIRKNHLSVELHKYRMQMNSLLSEFGLTPSSKTRLVSVKETNEEDPFVLLLARMTGDN